MANQQTQQAVIDVPVEPEAETGASLHLQIEPDIEAEATINGKVIGNGVQVIHANLIVGEEFELKVTADGYQTFEERYTVGPNERLRLPITMLPLPPPPQAEPKRTTKPTPKQTEAVTSTPIDTRNVEATDTPPPPAAPGKLNVNVRGGWAEVYIDGQRVDTTPLYHHQLDAGPHTVEIIHGATGERQTRQITIFPNQTTRITF